MKVSGVIRGRGHAPNPEKNYDDGEWRINNGLTDSESQSTVGFRMPCKIVAAIQR